MKNMEQADNNIEQERQLLEEFATKIKKISQLPEQPRYEEDDIIDKKTLLTMFVNKAIERGLPAQANYTKGQRCESQIKEALAESKAFFEKLVPMSRGTFENINKSCRYGVPAKLSYKKLEQIGDFFDYEVVFRKKR